MFLIKLLLGATFYVFRLSIKIIISSDDDDASDKLEAPRRKKSSRTGVAVVDPSEARSTSDMLTSAAIFSAVVVAGTFVMSKFKS